MYKPQLRPERPPAGTIACHTWGERLHATDGKPESRATPASCDADHILGGIPGTGHNEAMKTLPRPAILLSLSAVFSGFALANSYTFVTIHVPGSTSTTVRGINNSGDIVGTYTQANT